MFRPFILLIFLLLSANICHAQDLPYKAGFAKTDITFYKEGAGMLGYGMANNVVKGVKTRLYARSFVVEGEKGTKVAIVVCELCFVPSELKSAVIAELQKSGATKEFTDEQVMVLAQHTHSAPGGYCHYASYNMSVPGFIPELYDSLSQSIAQSIASANRELFPCSIRLNKGFFPDDWEVAFNRSLAAYNSNKEVTVLDKQDRNKAVNRSMTLLSFDGKNNIPLGSINWFGVHATSISNDNKLINADNKGYAATYLEQYFRAENKNYVGAFAQGSAGDVTPKFIYNKKHKAQRGYWEGKYPDDVKSAEYNGELQYKKARELIEKGSLYNLPSGKVSAGIRYFDFSCIAIDTAYSHTASIKYTSPSCVGASMLGGALMDGPGAPRAVLGLAKVGVKAIRLFELTKANWFPNAQSEAVKNKYAAQGKKDIVLETGSKKLLGTGNIKGLILPGVADPTVASFKRYDRAGALAENTWSPQILPIQLMQIGDVVLAAFPFEITTTAGYRLKKSIEDLYVNQMVKEVILCPYANSYSGYITTPEEYNVQMYEGGHSVFGEYSLAALQTVFKQLYVQKDISLNTVAGHLEPPVFSNQELAKRGFYNRRKTKNK